MKKIFSLLIILLMILTLVGCGKENSNSKNKNTPAYTLANSFKETIKKEKDISKIAQKISENEVLKTKVMIEERKTGDYLAGFDEEISNYNKAVVIAPVISTIPFVAYVFETDNVKELKKELESKANTRWNICTEADDKVIESDGKYVFFVMAPESFDE